MDYFDEVCIDFKLFVAEAICKQKKVYKLIDKLYKKNKKEFYNYAKKSEYYDHPFITEGILVQVEYARKFLGILEHESDHTLYSDDIIKICKEIYPITTIYVAECFAKKCDVSIEEHSNKLYFRYNRLDNVSDDFVNGSNIIMIFLAKLKGLALKDEPFNQYLIEYVYDRQLIYKNMDAGINSLKDKIKYYSKIYSTSILNNPFLEFETYTSKIEWTALFTNLNLSIYSIFDATEQDQEILKNIVGAYYLANSKNKISFEDYLFPAILIYRLGNAYNEVKKYYFKNNRETMYIEIEEMNKKASIEKQGFEIENERKIAEISALKYSLDNAQKHVDKLSKELEKLKKQNDELEKKVNIENTELLKLRELLFSDIDVEEKDNQIIDAVTIDNEIVIVGGHPQWINKIAEYVPNAIFIRNENFDKKVVTGKDVFIYYKYLSHSTYYRIISCDYASLNYLKYTNPEMCTNEIKKVLGGTVHYERE